MTTLSGKTAPTDPVLFQIQGNAETLDSVATALPQILGCPNSSMIHSIIQQRQIVLAEYFAAPNYAVLVRLPSDCASESKRGDAFLHNEHFS